MTTRTLINALWATAACLPFTLTGTALGQGGANQTPQAQQLRIGQQATGELNNQDFTTPDGVHIDVFSATLTGGENYRFTIQGEGFNAGVSVFTTDGNLIENAQVEFHEDGLTIQVPNTGTYSVAVMSDGTGQYTLDSRSGVAAPAAQEEAGGVQRMEGELNRDDPSTDDGILYDFVTLELEAGKTYFFGAVGTGFNPSLSVQDAEGYALELVVNEQDDSTQVIAVTVQTTGPHHLFILADAAGKTGGYMLTTWQQDPPAEDTPQNNGPRPDNGPRPNNPEPNNPEEAVGTTSIMDQLENTETQLEDGSYFDFHTVELVAGVTYHIDVTSDSFDTLAYLFDAENNQLDTNDDGPDMGSNSRIVFTPETTGEYSVGVSSVKPGKTGGYEVFIGPANATPQDGPADVEELVVDDEDPDDNGGLNYIIHADGAADAENNAVSDSFHLEAGQTIVIETYGLSDGCDTIARLFKAGGENTLVAENDDDEGLLSSRIVFTAEEAGEYFVEIDVYEGSAGQFSLVVRDPLPARDAIVAEGIAIEEDSFVVAGNFTFEAGPQYIVVETLDLTDDCDTVVELRRVVDPDNRNDDDPLIASNDDCFSNVLFSRIYFQCEEPGEYYVVIRNIGKGDGTCTFRVRFEQ